MNTWTGLALPTFACGHVKTPENTWRAGPWTRCRTCQRIRTAEYRATHGARLRPATLRWLMEQAA